MGMNEEYAIIREALIALLCVGDKINYIHYCSDGHYSIRESLIVAIHKKGIVIQNWAATDEICSLNAIEHYQGELYIWEEPQVMRDRKIERMIEIIESDDTDFEK
jgi:hypothetical protein